MGQGNRWRSLLLWVWARAHWLFPIAAAVTVLSCYLTVLNPFKPVMSAGGDNLHHVMLGYLFNQSMEADDNLLGPLGLDFGCPILRFYQPLFYLYNLGLHIATGLDERFLANFTVALFFSLSPLAYCFCMLKLGLRRFAAGIASMAALTSVAGFGNSFEAYQVCGIVTQSMGAFFFPLFIGTFAGLLRGENRAPTTALFFALAFLSHAIMAVHAVFSGALYFLVTPVSIKNTWKRLAAFSLLGACLIGFWALPFTEHTEEMRAVPDSIYRGTSRRWWFNSVSDDELVSMAVTGRLFDDARVAHAKQTDPLDKLTDQINIAHTTRVRPPVVTALVGLGVLAGLLLFRRNHARFLLAGLAFSLLLFAGVDDHPWLNFLPFMSHIQSFRCTYLVEFFAFGLVGIGVEALLRLMWGLFSAAPRPARIALRTLFAAAVLSGSAVSLGETATQGRRTVRVFDPTALEMMVDAFDSLPARGYPYRVNNLERAGVFKDYLGAKGFRPVFTHWSIVGPSLAMRTMIYLSSHLLDTRAWSLVGVRYVSGRRKTMGKVLEKKDKDGLDIWSRVPNGSDRENRNNSAYYMMDSHRDTFLRPLVGEPVPVVCRHPHWLWLARRWLERYADKLADDGIPVPMRIRDGILTPSPLLERADVLLYMDAESANKDREALSALAAKGMTIISPFRIEGVPVKLIKPGDEVWKTVSAVLKQKVKKRKRSVVLGDEETGFGRLFSVRHDDPRRSNQRYTFDVEVTDPVIATLPAEAVPGWTAHLDGERLQVFPTGPDMVGALLPKGAHRLTFRWEMPLEHRLALAATLAALGFVLCAWALSLVALIYLRLSAARAPGDRRR